MVEVGSVPIGCGIYAAIVQQFDQEVRIGERISQYPDRDVYAWQLREEKVFGFDIG